MALFDATLRAELSGAQSATGCPTSQSFARSDDTLSAMGESVSRKLSPRPWRAGDLKRIYRVKQQQGLGLPRRKRRRKFCTGGTVQP
ncbi:hypothetical protein [Candidatus Nitrospira allomarina]|uniref:Uncharacterized protein n=1 Tax=Candidatus Nitrospira allomarina TaxID=3020900 RepID=A0AA96JRT0_9BACT|nr:hypothetical protein [Candidatus Nitrospira allomarina]WNM57852.1 hypothetical protein PP769_18055 [Candidatus Nitrospira allomarina]